MSITGFINRKPIRRKKATILFLIVLSSFMFSTIFYYNFISNTPIPTNIPAVYITCDEEINEEDDVDCIIDLKQETIKSKIRLRGVTNANRAKKGYRINLYESKSLLGMREDNDWQLFSLYKDYDRMRVKLSMDLWCELLQYNPSAILPESRYVRLYLNGEFQGLYLLAEKNDRRLFKLDEWTNNIESSFILQAKFHTDLREYVEGSWEQDYPDKDNINLVDITLPELVNLMNNTSDEEFFDPINGIYSKFDKLNLIDFFVFNFFCLHKDFWVNNYFIIRNTNPSKLLLVPWDFDGTFGHWGSLKYSSTENNEFEIRQSNQLFNRLLDNPHFMEECKKRWQKLRDEIYKEEFILDMVSEIFEEIKDILKIELKMWHKDRFNDENFEPRDYLVSLTEWISERIEFCDSYFSQF